MGFKFKISTKDADDREGIVYVLIIRLEDGTEVYKIGVTKRGIQDRVVEILSSFWTQYRYFPYCYPKRFRKTNGIYEKEAKLHKTFEAYKYKFDKEFGGSSEFFHGVDLAKIVEEYENILQEC